MLHISTCGSSSKEIERHPCKSGLGKNDVGVNGTFAGSPIFEGINIVGHSIDEHMERIDRCIKRSFFSSS